MTDSKKYIIEVENIEGTDLYRAKGFNTLVFNAIGLSRLTPYIDPEEPREGDIITTPNGTVRYEYKGRSTDGRVNCINISTGRYTSLNVKNVVVVRHKWRGDGGND